MPPPSAIEQRSTVLCLTNEAVTSKIILPITEPKYRHQLCWHSLYFSTPKSSKHRCNYKVPQEHVFACFIQKMSRFFAHTAPGISD
jgi:hypothetical protein